MKILIVTTSYPSGRAGSEAAGSFVQDFARQINKNHQCAVVAPGRNNSTEILGGLTVYRYKTPEKPLSQLKLSNIREVPKICGALWHGMKVTTKSVRTFQPDHAFALWTFPSGLWTRIATINTKIRYSTWSLGSDIWSISKIPLVKNVLRYILNSSKINYADGLQLAHDVTQISNRPTIFLPSSRHIGTPPIRNQIGPPYAFSFIGRWHENKGIDILLNALMLLPPEARQNISRITLAGDGPLKMRLLQEIKILKKKGLPINTPGFVSKQQCIEILSQSDYLIIPSRIESIPVIFSDALACNAVPVTTPTGDLPDLIRNHQCGILAEQISADSLAQAISLASKTDPKDFKHKIEKIKAIFNITTNANRFIYNCMTEN